MSLFKTLMGSGTTQTSSMSLAGPDALEAEASLSNLQQFKDLRDLTRAGAGKQDVAAGLESQRSLAELLKKFSQGGFLPGQEDFKAAGGFVNAAFNPRQESLNQQFEDQNVQNNRLAAQLGRNVNDPTLRNMLARTQGNQQAMLDADKTAALSQEARNMPLQRLGFASDLANVNQSLANQAFSNRQTLLNMGNTIQNAGRNFRVSTATRSTNQSSDTGLLGTIGAVSGGLGGLTGIANNFQKLGSAFGGLSTGSTQGPTSMPGPKMMAGVG